MIRTFFILVLVVTSLKTVNMTAQRISLQPANNELVNLVEQTFAQGALNKLDIEQMSMGFHPEFNILIPKGNDVFKLSLDKWIAVVQEYKNSPKKMNSGIRDLQYKIEILDMTDCTAVVKTEFFRNDELIIVDYLSYIKFEDSWKAVSKISKDYITNPLNLDL